jgi:hypothetical protein
MSILTYSALEQEATAQTRGSMIMREYRSGVAEIIGRSSSAPRRSAWSALHSSWSQQ